jgi:two-component system alkaline phosphatase synthesis response regulator PhoP
VGFWQPARGRKRAGAGGTFSVTLPNAGQMAGSTEPKKGASPMPKRVLLCDDEIHILRAAEFKLKGAGHHVRIASDGQEAWELIEAQPPDILVTDYQMPRMDGLQLTRRVRECPELRDLPILMLTAKGFEISREELAETWNVRAVIAKPFSPRELLRTVEKILDESATPAADAEGPV